MLASFETFKSFFTNRPDFLETQWFWVATWMYFTVEDSNDVERIREELPAFVEAHYPKVLVEKGINLRIQKSR